MGGWGEGCGGGGRGRLYTYRYAVTTRMTPALRWAAMGAILTFHYCEGQSRKTLSTDHNFRRERRAEADSNRGPSAYQPDALPLGQSGSPEQAASLAVAAVQARQQMTKSPAPVPESHYIHCPLRKHRTL